MRKMRIPLFIGIIASTLLQITWALAQVNGATSVLAAADLKPTVRVIATVRTASTALRGETLESTAAKSRVMNLMRTLNAQLVEPIAGLPHVVIEVDSAGLQRL